MTYSTTDAAALANARWRKSSRSDNAAGCVELAQLPARLAVRDSKHPTGPALLFSPGTLAGFLRSARTPHLD
ncbi:DUF397 domain-containing protein [Actinokineospora sp.]|uniref:DUF397 domain-containing protein n=1 Tax=Actinokineospora sp. TaxID=1872133 RepID=UPI004037F93F